MRALCTILNTSWGHAEYRAGWRDVGKGTCKRGRRAGYRFSDRTLKRGRLNYSGGNVGLDRMSEGHEEEGWPGDRWSPLWDCFSIFKMGGWADPFQLWHSLIPRGEAGRESQRSRNVGQHQHLVQVISPVVHSFVKHISNTQHILDTVLRCWEKNWTDETSSPCPEKVHHLVGNVGASPFICSVWESRKALLRIKWEERGRNSGSDLFIEFLSFCCLLNLVPIHFANVYNTSNFKNNILCLYCTL